MYKKIKFDFKNIKKKKKNQFSVSLLSLVDEVNKVLFSLTSAVAGDPRPLATESEGSPGRKESGEACGDLGGITVDRDAGIEELASMLLGLR